MTRRLLVSIVLAVLTITAITILAAVPQRHAPVIDRTPKTPSDNIPVITAEITGIKSSPDFTRVALVLLNQDESESLAVFDPAHSKIVTQVPWEAGGSNGHPQITWSPDSRWLAAPNGDKGIMLLSKDGKRRNFKTTINPYYPLWREDSTHLLYLSPEGARNVYELDIQTGMERKTDTGHYVISLSNVNGKPVLSYMNGKNWDEAQSQLYIYVEELDSRKKILTLKQPGSNIGYPDFHWLEISPDGRFFFYGHCGSSCFVNVVGRSEDADTILLEPHKAILYQNTTNDSYSVSWSPSPPVGKENYDWYNKAIISNIGYLVFGVNLKTGSRDDWSDLRRADWWCTDPKSQFPDVPGMLVVIRQGLGIGRYPDPANEPKLLLKHKSLQ